MSRYMGSRVAGPIPPHIRKTKAGVPAHRPNKYAELKPSEQQNSGGRGER